MDGKIDIYFTNLFSLKMEQIPFIIKLIENHCQLVSYAHVLFCELFDDIYIVLEILWKKWYSAFYPP